MEKSIIMIYGQQTTDGGYILAGEMEALFAPETYALLIKTDDKGNVPRNRAMQTLFLQFLQNFLQNHPLLYQLLQRFIRI